MERNGTITGATARAAKVTFEAFSPPPSFEDMPWEGGMNLGEGSCIVTASEPKEAVMEDTEVHHSTEHAAASE